MTLIDTHCHLIDEAFRDDCDAVISRAIDAGIGKMILACCDETEIAPILSLSDQYPENLYPTIGIHPENLADDIEKQLAQVHSHLPNAKFVAIGEVGLDLHWDKSRLQEQIIVLKRQAAWAIEQDLPLILHIRDAMPEFIELQETELAGLASAQGKRLRGVLHCYSGTAEQAQTVLGWGDWYFGIGGTLTYKKSQLPDIVQAIGIDRIILETDAPYLAPMPHRGKRNEPAYTALTCQALADILGKSPEEIAEKTTRNAQKLFNLY